MQNIATSLNPAQGKAAGSAKLQQQECFSRGGLFYSIKKVVVKLNLAPDDDA